MKLPTIARHFASVSAALAVFVATTALAFAAPASDGDIRDIRGPIVIPPWWRWSLAAVLGAAALAVAVVLFRRWRAHARRPLTPLELARKALAAAELHARAGESRACAELLAETLRAALAVRLGTVVLPQTTAELAHGDWAIPPRSVELRAPDLLALLETCDLARFARATLDPASLLAATTLARELTEHLHAPPGHDRAPTPAPALAQTVTP